MSLLVSRSIEKIVVDACVAAYPDEGCGLLIGPLPEEFDRSGRYVRVDEARALPNAWNESAKSNRYLIDPRVLAKIEDEMAGTGRGVVGFFHSHPDAPAWPSPFDLSMAWPCLSYWILRLDEGKVVDSRSWQRTEDARSFIEEEIVLEG